MWPLIATWKDNVGSSYRPPAKRFKPSVNRTSPPTILDSKFIGCDATAFSKRSHGPSYVKCTQCKMFLCYGCWGTHLKFEATKEHRPKELVPAPPPPLCTNHTYENRHTGSKVKCVECKAVYCDNCASSHQLIGSAKKHQLVPLHITFRKNEWIWMTGDVFNVLAPPRPICGSSSIDEQHTDSIVKCVECNEFCCIICVAAHKRIRTVQHHTLIPLDVTYRANKMEWVWDAGNKVCHDKAAIPNAPDCSNSERKNPHSKGVVKCVECNMCCQNCVYTHKYIQSAKNHDMIPLELVFENKNWQWRPKDGTVESYESDSDTDVEDPDDDISRSNFTGKPVQTQERDFVVALVPMGLTPSVLTPLYIGSVSDISGGRCMGRCRNDHLAVAT